MGDGSHSPAPASRSDLVVFLGLPLEVDPAGECPDPLAPPLASGSTLKLLDCSPLFSKYPECCFFWRTSPPFVHLRSSGHGFFLEMELIWNNVKAPLTYKDIL